MIIDHICFAVKDLEEAIDFWVRVFEYRQLTNAVTNSRQQVEVVFLTKKNSLTIKLIKPTDRNVAVNKFIQRGGGFHHVSFKCSNVSDSVDELKENGLITVVPPQPGEAFDNEQIAFMRTRFGLNIELIDTEKKMNHL